MSRKRYMYQLRDKVLARDRGICAHCGIDCEKIRRVFWSILDFDAQVFYATVLGLGSHGKTFWEADHIIEVVDGGSDSPRNLQTLCIPCHKVKTAASWKNRPPREQVITCPEIYEADWGHEYYKDNRAQYCYDYAVHFIVNRVKKNPDWPKRLEPQPPDFYSEMIYH